jgi:hypothetical protein
MEKIKIEIYDDLSPIEELQAINKQMLKALPKGKSKKLIGDQVTIKHLKSQIEIVRVPRVKVNTLLICTVCSNNFEKKLGKPLYVNYGGIKKVLHYCSETCRGVVAEICGDTRASVKSKEVKNAYFYQH